MKKITYVIFLLIVSLPVFSIEQENPDIIILTESLAELPQDVVANTLFSKVFTRDQIFKYQEEPTFLEIKGFLRRLAYEKDLSITEDVIKFFLSTEAEVLMWKDNTGRIGNYQIFFPVSKIKKTLLSFVLEIAKISKDSQISVVNSEGEKKVGIFLGSKKIHYLLSDEYFMVSSFDPNHSIDEIKKMIHAKGSSNYEKKPSSGIYSALIGSDRQQKRHVVFVDAKFVTFNYQYFFPYLRGFVGTFESKKWSYHSVIGGEKIFAAVQTSEIWQMAPMGPAMCLALPVDMNVVSEMLKFQNKNSDELEGEVHAALQTSPVGVCWYEDSELMTPVFFMKPKQTKDMSSRLKHLFAEYVGMYEYEENGSMHKFPVEEKTSKDGISLVRHVSSPGGKYSSPDTIPGLKYDRFFKAKMIFHQGSIVFSADDALVDKAEKVISKKAPSLFDSMKKEKNLNFVVYPSKLSEMAVSYINEVLRGSPNSVFYSTTKKFFENASKNLQLVQPFGFQIPTSPTKKEWKVVEIPVVDL